MQEMLLFCKANKTWALYAANRTTFVGLKLHWPAVQMHVAAVLPASMNKAPFFQEFLLLGKPMPTCYDTNQFAWANISRCCNFAKQRKAGAGAATGAATGSSPCAGHMHAGL